LSTRIIYDISIWEEIRSIVRWKTDQLVGDINKAIPKDLSLAEFQSKQPVPWQLREIMEHRANAWVQSIYDLCCDAQKDSGKPLSADFDRAVWAYWIEPFIMGEKRSDSHNYTVSKLLDLLFCAVGSPPEKRDSLKVSQRECCLAVRLKVHETWYDKLLHQTPRINEAVAAMAAYNAREARAARIVAGLPPEPPPPPTPALPLAQAAASGPPQTAPVPLSATVPASPPLRPVQEGSEGRVAVLPSKPDIQSSDWKSITPERLVLPIARVRATFKREISELNPGGSKQSFERWAQSLAEVACVTFRRLLFRIALPKAVAHPVEWASVHVRILITEELDRLKAESLLDQQMARTVETLVAKEVDGAVEAARVRAEIRDWRESQPATPVGQLPAAFKCLLKFGEAFSGSATVIPAETEPQGVTEGDMPTQSSNAGVATWDTIEILFLSDERVQICNGTNSETRNYAELGFADDRDGKPNQAWVALRALAEQRGVTKDAAEMHQPWPKVEKRIQEIRKALRKHFGISDDPIQFVKRVGYQAKFKIGCSPSFDT